MKSVLEYQDYRAFIQDYYDEMKSRKLLSWRSFAKQAGFSSVSYLKMLCQGKTTLSAKGIEQVAQAMNLKGKELEYFRILVNFNQAKTGKEKETFFTQLSNFEQSIKQEIMEDTMYSYFSSWLNPVLRELAPNVSSTKPSEIARRFVPEVNSEEIKAALQFLTDKGFLVKNAEGRYEQAEKIVSSRNKEVATSALRNLHRQIGSIALDSLDNVPIDERNFSELILGISKDGYKKIIQEIADFRKKILDIATQDQGLERVYSLNFQLFPLTRKNTSNPAQKKIRANKKTNS